MSRMIPQETIDVLRSFNDVSVDLYGIECELRVPINLNKVERNDVYAKPDDYSYRPYQTLVYIEWKADEKKLRKLGVFTEKETPIIAWFKNDPVITIKSYIIVPIQYIPKQFSDTDEFEIVDMVVKGMHDAVILNCYKLAPRRVRRT